MTIPPFLLKFTPFDIESLSIPMVMEYKEYRIRIKDLNARGNVVKDNNNYIQVFKNIGDKKVISFVDLSLYIKNLSKEYEQALLILFEVKEDKTVFYFANLQNVFTQENLASFSMGSRFYDKDFKKISFLVSLYSFSANKVLIAPMNTDNQQARAFSQSIQEVAQDCNLSCMVLPQKIIRESFWSAGIVESSKHTKYLILFSCFFAPLFIFQSLLSQYTQNIEEKLASQIKISQNRERQLENELMNQAQKIEEADNFLKQNLKVCE